MEEAQRDRAQRPLMLVKTANTRKWSSSFLMLSRLVRLYDYVATMERFIATDRPEPREALTTWRVLKEQQLPPRTQCEAVCDLLWWIYVGEQTIQKDGSSVIHGTFIFEDICAAVLSGAEHRVPRIIQERWDERRVRDIVSKRRELLQSSGIYWLSLALWPLPTLNAVDHHGDAFTELEEYSKRCWNMWQRNREIVGLNSRFFADIDNQRDMEEKLESFCINAQQELTEHLVQPTSTATQRARSSFQARTQQITARLAETQRTVKRGHIVDDSPDDNDSVHVRGYWLAVTSRLPSLALIARSLLATCASEAGVERLFSKEGFIHNNYRNRLGTDIGLAIVRGCLNVHAIHGEAVLGLDSDHDSSDDGL